ncbi:hypothetical protein FB451DRAFT_1390431 [Mycena latifolia]|nr:hypothetical protein FB451DRAFT_1390431 [Mycena latifolia]
MSIIHYRDQADATDIFDMVEGHSGILGHSGDLQSIPSSTTGTTLLQSLSEAGPYTLNLELHQSSARNQQKSQRAIEYPTFFKNPLISTHFNPEPLFSILGSQQGIVHQDHEIHLAIFIFTAIRGPNALVGYATGGDPRQPAPNANINGGTFISVGGNVNHIQRHGEAGLHILYRSAAGDASHDAGDRYPQPRCHPATRTEMLEDLYAWSSENDPESRVLWLHGPAGAGKSAIAQSFCQKLEFEGRLGGSLFFKRGHGSRGNASKLFPTLAYQLALAVPELKRVVARYVEDDPSIVDKSHSIQLQKLIIEPFQDTGLTRPFIIIIDGLDECEGQDIQQEILRSIGNSFQRSHLPLRFLVASRPEPHIGEVFRGPYFTGFHRPLNIQKSFEVRRYLQNEFGRIHREHWVTMATVSSPWPSQEVINNLVEKSSGYFIYASTVIKFIDDKNFCPADRLEIIMGIVEPDSESPYAALDQLYIQILAAVPSRSQLLRILTVIASGLIPSSVARYHGGQRDSEITFIQQLLDLKPGGVLLALRGLHSVIKVVPGDEDATHWQLPWGPELDVYHASFLDFLNDSTQSGVFYVGGFQRTQLACDILKTFSYNPTANPQNREGHLAW